LAAIDDSSNGVIKCSAHIVLVQGHLAFEYVKITVVITTPPEVNDVGIL
jgi:hypothetical protein